MLTPEELSLYIDAFFAVAMIAVLQWLMIAALQAGIGL